MRVLNSDANLEAFYQMLNRAPQNALLLDYDGGIELRVSGIDKGVAVDSILKEMDKDCVAAYLGDDKTDEDAFITIKGRGIGLLVRSELRPTAADIWIRPPGELIAFLSRWLQETQSEK